MTPQKLLTDHLIPSSLLRRGWVLILLAAGSFAFSPQTRAACDSPDPGCPGGNLAEGFLALGGLTSGAYNTGIGTYALLSLTDGNFCAATGAGALFSNTANENTATGAGALFSNTTGSNNTAVGAFALFTNSDGGGHTAVGVGALQNNNASGLFSSNTAVGISALVTSTSGGANVAVGEGALLSVDTGSANTAIGALAGSSYTADETSNICIGAGTTGSAGDDNTIRIGDSLPSGGIDVIDGGPAANFVLIGTGLNTQGISIGTLIGFGNVSIANGLSTTAGASSCNIGGIYNQSFGPNDLPVRIGDNNVLGTVASSRRFKHDIKPIDKASEAILALKPVTFHYKSDTTNTARFGFIAEDVAEVSPELVIPDKEGKPLSVRYEDVNVMLLNEFLKEHKKVEELQGTVAQQQKGMEILTAQLKEQAAQIQKVSAQLEAGKPATKVALGNQ